MTTVAAGIDVSKSSLDVPVNGEDRRSDNDGISWRALNAWLKQRDINRVVPEATGRFYRSVEQSLHDHDDAAIVVNPLRARHFAETMGHLEKTERVDARVLVVFGQVCPALVAVASRTAFLNRPEDLLTVRAHCVAMRASLENSHAGITKSSNISGRVCRIENYFHSESIYYGEPQATKCQLWSSGTRMAEYSQARAPSQTGLHSLHNRI